MKIIGAGISGLSLGYFLRNENPVIYEKTKRAGGWIRTVEQDGFLFELGPRGFLHNEGTLQLARELGLQPLLATKNRRFLLQGDQLKPFSLWLLLKNGLLRDLFTRKSRASDESVATFFRRHFGQKFVENIADPLIKGIYGGDVENLSIKNCFPTLWELDQKQGRLLHIPRKKGGLYSFKEGMEELPRALAKRLTIHYNCTAEEGLIACPQKDAPPYLSITTVSCGWHDQPLPKRGFGFLAASKEKKPYLGMTWDSEVFPFQKGKSRICVMTLSENAKEVALEAIEQTLGLKDPDAILVHHCPHAIPQYPLNYVKPNHVGHNCSVNSCIAAARHYAATILKWSS